MTPIILAGLGGGTEQGMTVECRTALEESHLILGAERLRLALPPSCRSKFHPEYRPSVLLEQILSQPDNTKIVVAYTGDSGFYSGTSGLLPLLQKQGIPVRVLSGVSSVQLLAAALGRPWQDWNLVSAHGTSCDAVAHLRHNRPTFYLTGGVCTPALLCQQLVAVGLGSLSVTVGERLSYPEEQITQGTASELSTRSFHPLSVLLAEAVPDTLRPSPRVSGLPDSAFLRDKVPMTKQVVRAAALGKLGVKPTDIGWDVGAGTGSVSIELALAAPQGRVYAVECNSTACALIEQNRKRFCLSHLELIQGYAPEVLDALPAPDVVFIGGTKGNMAAIVDCILKKNPKARICISAIALETLSAAVAALTAHGLEATVTQIAVSESKAVAGLHMMTANNPIFLIGGNYDV